MIEYKINLGEKEKEAIIGAAMQNKKFKRTQLIMQIIVIIIGCGVFALGFFEHSMLIMAMSLLFFLIAAGIVPIQKSGSRKKMAQSDARLFSGTREYKVDETGIEITSYAGTSKLLWNGFMDYGEYENYLWIRTADRRLVLFNKNDLSAEQLNELMGYIVKNINK